MGDLETLKAIATLRFLSDDIEDGVNELGSLCVVSFGPVVACTSLPENEVVLGFALRAKKMSYDFASTVHIEKKYS